MLTLKCSAAVNFADTNRLCSKCEPQRGNLGRPKRDARYWHSLPIAIDVPEVS
jgi:hypothetical protein